MTPSCFNPRLPGGRRPRRSPAHAPGGLVSIHAFRGEGDRAGGVVWRRGMEFQSTPSGGKATAKTGALTPRPRVSIHAFRGEGDAMPTDGICICRSFNPRLPGGRRPQEARFGDDPTRFNPRLPGGRRPSIAPRTRGAGGFNPRLPGGRRRDNGRAWNPYTTFQSTPSGGKATAISRVAMPCFRQIL